MILLDGLGIWVVALVEPEADADLDHLKLSCTL